MPKSQVLLITMKDNFMKNDTKTQGDSTKYSKSAIDLFAVNYSSIRRAKNRIPFDVQINLPLNNGGSNE